jgi:Protein of unknown function (DUF2948)
LLHLTAFDKDDLPALSAQMQDAVLRTADLSWNKTRKQFVLAANRFAWDALPDKVRRRCGLRFNHVMAVRRNFLQTLPRDGILSLLAITFEAGDGLGGTVLLTFSGGHRIALDVEVIDAQLDDLGPAWGTQLEPSHDG